MMDFKGRKLTVCGSLLGLFFLSGASSLIFETLWQRLMMLEFGASAPATTAILTAFFTGIAFGSRIGAWLARRVRNVLLLYGLTEFWIGVWGLAVPFLLRLAESVYVEFFQTASPSPAVAYLVRFLLSILVVLPATLGMGATIPLMNRLIAQFLVKAGRSVAVAFGLNTLGAVMGCLAGGFLLLPNLGVTHTLYTAVSLNGTVVLASLLLLFRFGPGEEGCMPDRAVQGAWGGQGMRTVRVFLGLYFVTGFLALGYEILWFRILGIYNTNSFTTFTLMLSTYLLGFAVGSFGIFPVLARRLKAGWIFVLSNFGVGASSLALVPVIYLFADINNAFITKMEDFGIAAKWIIVCVEFGFSLALMFLPTMFMGLAYPALCQALIGEEEDVGEKSGLIYYIGTLGSALGVMIVGLLFIPRLGLAGTLGGLCVVSLLVASASGIVSREIGPGRRKVVICSLVLGGVALGYAARGYPFLKFHHVRAKGDAWEIVAPPDAAIQSTVLSYLPGQTATVSVWEEEYRNSPRPPERRLYVDAHAVASTHRGAKVDAKMLAHLPLLLHSDPKRALTVGFGSGGTSWSMTRHDIEVDCVEIEPAVVREADFFKNQNHGVLGEKNFNVIINDARDYLHRTQRRYDVISTDVTNLQYKQNGSLYTKEAFELMRSRLSHDGIACAWSPMESISLSEYKTLLKTFSEVFPHTSVWFMNHSLTNFVIFIGTPGPLKIDVEQLRARVRANSDVRDDLAEIGVNHPYQFVNFLLQDEEGVRRFVAGAELHTDDFPVLEFALPVSFYQRNRLFVTNLMASLAFRPKEMIGYVENLDSTEVEVFDKYAQASRLWSEVVARFYQDKMPADPFDLLANMERAIELARKAVDLLPDDEQKRTLLNYLERRREQLKAAKGGEGR